jgi:hypothetical protein
MNWKGFGSRMSCFDPGTIQHLHGGIEENHREPQSGFKRSGQDNEHRTIRVLPLYRSAQFNPIGTSL